MINSVPISIALVAGGLSVVNPCGFPLLPAFLSFYFGADEEQLPPAPTRAAQGLLVGGLVAIGFLGFFALVGLPVSFGVGAIARAVPWAGLTTGAVLAIVGLVTLLRVHIRLPVQARLRVRRERRLGAMLLFGTGYGAASLGCTLPLFLALVGASLGGAKLTAFVAYGIGMAVVLMALSVLVALAREGAARVVRPVLPYMSRIAGVLLLASGGYLFYYWARLRFGDSATVADDPVVSFGVRFSGQVRSLADGRGSTLVAIARAIVALALVSSLWQRHRRGMRRSLARQMIRLAYAATVVLLILVASGCGSGGHSQAHVKHSTQPSTETRPSTLFPSSPRQLTDLRDIGQLRSLFNTRSGEPRLILLVSPT